MFRCRRVPGRLRGCQPGLAGAPLAARQARLCSSLTSRVPDVRVDAVADAKELACRFWRYKGKGRRLFRWGMPGMPPLVETRDGVTKACFAPPQNNLPTGPPTVVRRDGGVPRHLLGVRGRHSGGHLAGRHGLHGLGGRGRGGWRVGGGRGGREGQRACLGSGWAPTAPARLLINCMLGVPSPEPQRSTTQHGAAQHGATAQHPTAQ